MSDIDGHGLVDVSPSVLQPASGVVDGDEEALDHRGQEDQCHGDPEERVQDAKHFALTRQRGLVAIA